MEVGADNGGDWGCKVRSFCFDEAFFSEAWPTENEVCMWLWKGQRAWGRPGLNQASKTVFGIRRCPRAGFPTGQLWGWKCSVPWSLSRTLSLLDWFFHSAFPLLSPSLAFLSFISHPFLSLPARPQSPPTPRQQHLTWLSLQYPSPHPSGFLPVSPAAFSSLPNSWVS